MQNNEQIYDTQPMGMIERVGGKALATRMIDMFLDKSSERQLAIQAALDGADHDALERVAHSLKSSAGQVGLLRLSANSEALEQYLASRRGPGVETGTDYCAGCKARADKVMLGLCEGVEILKSVRGGFRS